MCDAAGEVPCTCLTLAAILRKELPVQLEDLPTEVLGDLHGRARGGGEGEGRIERLAQLGRRGVLGKAQEVAAHVASPRPAAPVDHLEHAPLQHVPNYRQPVLSTPHRLQAQAAGIVPWSPSAGARGKWRMQLGAHLWKRRDESFGGL